MKVFTKENILKTINDLGLEELAKLIGDKSVYIEEGTEGLSIRRIFFPNDDSYDSYMCQHKTILNAKNEVIEIALITKYLSGGYSLSRECIHLKDALKELNEWVKD